MFCSLTVCSVNKLHWLVCVLFVKAFESLKSKLFLDQNVLPLILPFENKDLLLFHIMSVQMILLNILGINTGQQTISDFQASGMM